MTICPGCNEPTERGAQTRTYHSQCDPQMRAEMLERALQLFVDAHTWCCASDFNEAAKAARAALAYKPVQMTGAVRAASVKCDPHEFKYVRRHEGTNGVVGRCILCNTTFTAWPRTMHYEEIVAARDAAGRGGKGEQR